MLWLDVSLPTPEENLALDEALLDICEKGAADSEEFLRFWESDRHFVVLGISGKFRDEVDAEACARDGVPLLRRSSGGGTVLQGPGCLNFSLVLSLDRRPELRDTSKGFRAILERTARALQFDELSLQGISDLTLGDRKISGNAQKRRRRALLHHGTLLHHFDVERVARWLRDPEKQPEYRKRRPHGAFLGNLPAAPEDIKSRLACAWGASPPRGAWKMPGLDRLISEKYGNIAWTHRS